MKILLFLPKETINYADSIMLDIPYSDNQIQDIYVEDANHKRVDGLEFEVKYNKLIIKNTYYLGLGETFYVAMIVDNKIIKKEIAINENIGFDGSNSYEDYMKIYYLTMLLMMKKGFIIHILFNS